MPTFDVPDTLSLTEDEVWAALDAAVKVTDRPHKHGYYTTAVFKHDNGAHYRFSVYGMYENGLSIQRETLAERVVEERLQVTEWFRPALERRKDDSNV